MKKLLTVTAVLLTAALLFTGCKNAANSDGGEDLPGTWVSSLDYYQPYTANNWTGNKNTISYDCSNVSSLGIETGYTMTYASGLSEGPQLYGVRAKIKQNTFTDAEPGIILFKTSSADGKWDTYYTLTFWKGSYILYEKLSGQERTCISKTSDGTETYSNTWHKSIKEEGNTNEVLFYTDGDKLVLKVNGSTVTTIQKKLDTGDTGACIVIPSDATGSINANWEFLEFQTGK